MSGLRSMTGHGVGVAELARGQISIEIRTVNHRGLDVRVRLPLELADHGGLVEEQARRSLVRGRVEVLGRLDGPALAPATLDFDRARRAYSDLCRLRDELRPDEPVPLSLLTGIPDLWVTREPGDHEAQRAALELATSRACEAVWSMRSREGEALTAELRMHLAAITGALAAIRERVPRMVDAYREKLTARLARLLAGSEVALNEGRLEHEVALFADRSDVTEEVARLGSHLVQAAAVFEESGESPGKKLDFLLQEIGREVGTLGAKSADADIARWVVEMKTAVNRMREQVQNVL